MSEMICPHCRGEVPRNASVCRGCQAEIEYGAPKIAFMVALLVSFFLGFTLAGRLPDSIAFLGWIAGLGVFIGACILIAKMFKDRVNFKRIYRTK